ncbi:MAG TPA: winged helix-turn-helix domain-containing protein [Anaerolineae bacterium]|nr:winged helix-turn-helix domain-containing protein [Anaerolineae bacterium]
MQTLTITKRQARRFLLAHQGLWPPYALKGKAGVLEYIHRVGCIQFDPLNIVGRNPELVLQARIANFRPALLQELLYEDRELLDGWDKNMSIYSVEDWPNFHRRREAALQHTGRSHEAIQSFLPQIRKEIKQRGPVSSIDLDFDQTIDWWWAPTRVARAVLESMYHWGELVIHSKVNTRKVYDFARHHLPNELLSASDPNQTEEQFHDWYVLRRIGGIGLMWNRAGDAWLGMSGIKGPERRAALERLLQKGKVLEVFVEGIEQPLFMRSEDWKTFETILDARNPSPKASILAPLDNLLWDRRFVEQLFGFSYVWEVYKPAAERQFGYYVLPILYGDRFIARFEPKREKKIGTLIIKQWWWEPGVRQSKRMQLELIRCFKRFLKFLNVNGLLVDDKACERSDLYWLAEAVGS